MEAKKRSLAVLLCAAAIGLTSVAQAQNPELGDTGEAPAWGPPAASASGSASASSGGGVEMSGDTSSGSSTSRSGAGSHADVVGRFGVGFLGITGVPVCDGDLNAACGGEVINVPAIGVRYWLSDFLGIEIAVGLRMSSGTREVADMGGSNEVPDPSRTGFLLHGAVPLSLAHSGDFSFQVVPELNFGIASGTNFGATQDQDIDVSGMLFQLGGRVGAEVHFGFIGLPQLSLQGTVGLHLTFDSRSGSLGTREASRTTTLIGTTVQDDPWDIFTGSIAAIYYL